MCSASVHMSRRGGPLPAGASLPTSRLGTPPAWRVSLPLQSYIEAACCTDKVQLEALCKAKHMQQEPALFHYSVTECRGHLKRADDCACRTVCSETLSNVVSLCTSCHTPQQMLREQGTRQDWPAEPPAQSEDNACSHDDSCHGCRTALHCVGAQTRWEPRLQMESRCWGSWDAHHDVTTGLQPGHHACSQNFT